MYVAAIKLYLSSADYSDEHFDFDNANGEDFNESPYEGKMG